MIPWAIASIAIIIVILAVVAFIMFKKEGKSHKPDYYTFFVLGLIWLPMGIIGMIRDGYSVFFTLGLIFFTIGIVHKDEWKKNHKPFKALKGHDKTIRIVIIIGLGLLVLVALGVLFYKNFI